MSVMAERPLEQIRKESKAAQRAPHLRKQNITPTDLIDSLDNITGMTYHHDGPYDATLAARNKNPKYAPVEAVKVGNLEAIRATPYEQLQDSLTKHVPLSGTAVIPPGGEDLAGRTMNYEEGADLMREEEAEGGPYRRWKAKDDFYKYHPDDLKGKGEPSFTIERQLKGHNGIEGEAENGVYEMQPSNNTSSPTKGRNAMVRQRSHSSSAGPSSPIASSSGVGRSNTTSHHRKQSSLDGLKRRIGSLRRKSPES